MDGTSVAVEEAEVIDDKEDVDDFEMEVTAEVVADAD